MHAENWHNQLKDRRTGIHTRATIDYVIYFLDDAEQRHLIKDEIIKEGQRRIAKSHARMMQIQFHPKDEWQVIKRQNITAKSELGASK